MGWLGRPYMVIWSHINEHTGNLFHIIIISGRCSAVTGRADNGDMMDCYCHAALRDFV